MLYQTAWGTVRFIQWGWDLGLGPQYWETMSSWSSHCAQGHSGTCLCLLVPVKDTATQNMLNNSVLQALWQQFGENPHKGVTNVYLCRIWAKISCTAHIDHIIAIQNTLNTKPHDFKPRKSWEMPNKSQVAQTVVSSALNRNMKVSCTLTYQNTGSLHMLTWSLSSLQ